MQMQKHYSVNGVNGKKGREEEKQREKVVFFRMDNIYLVYRYFIRSEKAYTKRKYGLRNTFTYV